VTLHFPSDSPRTAPEHSSPLPGYATGTDPAGHDEWSGIECARTLYRRRSTLAWITCFGILAAALISLAQPRLYQSQASIEIEETNGNFLNLRDIYPTVVPSADSNGVYLQTQAESLQQDTLIEQVVKKLRLDQRPEYQDSRDFWEKLLPVTNPASSSAVAARNAVEVVKKNLKIVTSRGSRIIRIVCDARDPQLAADLANTVAQTFIEQSIETRQQAAQQTRDALSAQLDAFRSKLFKSEAELGAYAHPSGVVYNTLKQELDANRHFYQTMSQRVNDASVASAVRQPPIRLIGPAQPPTNLYKPNLPLNLAIGTFGGLALAVGAVMLQEQTNSALCTPGEAGMYLTVPELGAIPEVAARRRLLSSGEESLGTGRDTVEQQFSGLSESFRAISASILSAGQNGSHPRILLVTSSRAMEGKTTAVSNLGVALAEISGKVLLIDGDMRRPRLHKVFDQANSWGLSDLLREKNAIEDLPLDVLVKKTAVPHLYLLPSGAGADNIFSLLCSSRMARLFPRFRAEFDYVLVDAPPCLEFADARIMARYTEKALVVVRANYTDRQTALAAVQRLVLDGIPVMGVILNRLDPARSDIYGYPTCYRLDRRSLA